MTALAIFALLVPLLALTAAYTTVAASYWWVAYCARVERVHPSRSHQHE